jgi:hypothetical protein
MLRTLPLLAGCVVLALGGLVHGLWSDRWGTSEAVIRATERLEHVPLTVGDWEGENETVSRRDLALSGATGCLARRYTNRSSGEVISVILLCGKPGPVSVHTPDVCYRGLGFEPVSTPSPWKSKVKTADQLAEFLTSTFRKEEPGRVTHLRIFWSWSATGVWQGHGNPRWTFANQPVLYKLYLVRQLTEADEDLESDPTNDFLHEFLPRLQEELFSES